MKPSPELAALFEPVLKWLDQGGDDDLRFDMTHLIDSCGTSACIVGALGVFNPELNWHDYPHETAEQRALYANDLLRDNYGLTPEDEDELFFTHMDLNAAQAAAMVRHWIETGDVINPHHPNPWEALDDA